MVGKRGGGCTEQPGKHHEESSSLGLGTTQNGMYRRGRKGTESCDAWPTGAQNSHIMNVTDMGITVTKKGLEKV